MGETVVGGDRLPQRAPFPSVELPEKARGQRAIDLLGARLPEVAEAYGKSPAELASILRRDRNAWLDRQGRLFYQEDLDAPLQADAPLETPSLTAAALFRSTRHSCRTAVPVQRTIYSISRAPR
jgi:hypothetical protein